MSLDLSPQIVDVDVARLIARHDNHAHSGHSGSRRIRAVSRRRYQDHITPTITPVALVRPNHHQARKLPLRARIRL